MKIPSKPIACLLAVLTLAAVQAKATLIYDNGPINGTITAWNVSSGSPYSVSDSFTVTGSASLSSAQVGLWVLPGDAPSTIGWSIGTAPFLSNISSGTSSLTNTFFGTGFGFYDIYQSVFNISGIVGSGTYYLTLGNGTNNNNFVFWDQNNGPSTAYQTLTGQLPGSQSFQIFGTVPDAGSSVMLLGIGLAGLGMLRRAKRA